MPPTRRDIRDSIEAVRELWEGRALELAEVASGYRMQVRASHSRWMTRLWAERAPRYTRALLETLALIAYRQPITRGQIEDVRGVSVSSSIIRTLLEREWIRVVGHREVPGSPRPFRHHARLSRPLQPEESRRTACAGKAPRYRGDGSGSVSERPGAGRGTRGWIRRIAGAGWGRRIAGASDGAGGGRRIIGRQHRRDAFGSRTGEPRPPHRGLGQRLHNAKGWGRR